MDNRNAKHTQGTPETSAQRVERRTKMLESLSAKARKDIENMKQGMKYSDELMNTRCTK